MEVREEQGTLASAVTTIITTNKRIHTVAVFCPTPNGVSAIFHSTGTSTLYSHWVATKDSLYSNDVRVC